MTEGSTAIRMNLRFYKIGLTITMTTVVAMRGALQTIVGNNTQTNITITFYKENNMPNWCNNYLSIKTSDKKLYNKIKKHMEQGAKKDKEGNFTEVGLLGLLYPEPDYERVEVKEAFGKGIAKKSEAWWDWRVTNWGTKWDIRSDDILGDLTCVADDKSREYEIELDFDSAWSPPIEWLRYCEQKYERQNLTFHLTYFEGGMGFGGVYDTASGDAYYEFEQIKDAVLNGTKDEALSELIDVHCLTRDDFLFDEEEVA